MSKQIPVLFALAVLLALLSSGCATISMKMPANRFDSPEARGGLLKAYIDPIAFEGSSELTLVNDYTIVPPPVNAPQFNSSMLDYAIDGGVGLLERLDFTVKMPTASPTLFGVKYQFLGAPGADAHAGNIALAATLAGGYGSDSGSASAIFNTDSSSFTMGEWAWDASIIAGVRVLDMLLVYAGPFYTQYALSGTITQPSPDGNSYAFGGVARQFGTSLGYEIDAGIIELKFNVVWAHAIYGTQALTGFYPGFLAGFRF